MDEVLEEGGAAWVMLDFMWDYTGDGLAIDTCNWDILHLV